jgi:hypothetical protein
MMRSRILSEVSPPASSRSSAADGRHLDVDADAVAGVEGLEPPTLGLEIRCSILLSYTPSIIRPAQISAQ